MLETLFRAFLILQPFLWIWILEDDRFEFLNHERVKDLFTYASLFVIVGVWIGNISIGFYSRDLLLLYSCLVWWGILVLMKNFNWHFREALATSFLLVYLNSWYWESFLHIWAIQENGINMNQMFQLLHLIPGVYFLIRYEFDKDRAINELAKGFMVSTVIGLSKKTYFWVSWGLVKYAPSIAFERTLMNLNRIISFIFLFRAIIVWGMNKKIKFIP